MISMSGMVEIHFLTSSRKCKFIGRIDHLNALPVLPQGIKRHFILKAGEQVKVDLPSGFYKVTALDENYREISAKFDRGTSMKLKEVQFCDTLVENSWTLSAYLTEIPQTGYDPYVLTKWTR